AVGSTHTIAAVSPQGTGGTRQTFTSWSDAGALSHVVTAPAAATTFTASFTTQFLLTAAASPAAGGSVTASPLSPDGFYASGTIVQLTATPNANFHFANWSGDLAGAANPQQVTMSAPHTVAASFSALTGITVATNPPGLSVTVDGVTFVSPQTFNWTVGSTHTIAAVSPQGTGGTRQTFTSWSDAEALSHVVTAPAAATTFTASFTTQFLLTAAASPAAGGSVTASPLSPDGFYPAGTIVQLTAAPSANFQFANWSGDLAGAANPQTVTMSAPHTVTASFSALAGITVATNPPGLSVTVDGATFITPQTFNWTVGSTHTIAAVSPQGTGGTRQTFTSWSDAGALSHVVTAPAAATTFTASFTTQFLLTAAASPAAGGSVTASPVSPDGFYAAGAIVQLTAAPSANFQFANWSGDLAGAANPQTVTMSAPHTVTASFSALAGITVATNPPGLNITVDGATFVAPRTFNWTVGSTHTIAAVSPQGTGGTRQTFASWSDAGALSHVVTAPAAATTFTASFTTLFLLTAAASPAAGGSVTASPVSPDGFYAAGAIVQLTAAPSANFQFANWSGDLAGAANPQQVTMSAPHTVAARFSALAGITVATNPPGLSVTVDGATYTAPQTFNWTAGSTHTIAVSAPQGTAGTRHSFVNWSDQGPQTHTLNAPSGAATYTANFTTDYLLTAVVSPAGSGNVAAVPLSPDGYYPAGASVQLTATAAADYQFNGWAAGLSGAANPQVVTLAAPLGITANFQARAPAAITAPSVAALTPAAFYKPVAVSPGLIATVFGDRMGPQQFALGAAAADGKFPASLAGTRVLFDNVPGALIYTSQQQVSVVVPYAVDGKSSTLMVVEYNGQRSDPYRLDVAAAAPGIFAADSSGSGPGAILNAHDDGTVALNTAQAPAPQGSYISVYMTGEGQTNPGGVEGSIALAVLPKPLLKVTATVGGVPATVIYAGAAPGLIAGVMQVNLQVPPDAPSGPAVPLAIQVGDKQSQTGITVAIGN
ncbi:MAG: hypothetical protein LAP87_07335, partial [Acidobacteriia bacterium]|nr:hypothetical protein [Terriglobia bacterium]